MTEPLDAGLPDDVRALVEAERSRPEPGPEVERRIREGVERAIHPGSGTPTSGAAIASRTGWLIGGMVLGALLHALWTDAPDETTERRPVVATTDHEAVESPTPSDVREPPADATSEEPRLESDAAPQPTTTQASPGHRQGLDRDDLGRERLLIEEARVALREGRFPAAIAASRRYARRFPRGSLSEESLALEARALLAAGRADDARRRVAELVERFPQSFHRGALERELTGQAAPEE